jgi:hypothetical protein
MPRQNSIQTAWTKGEVSPLAAGRVDVNLYASGATTLENMLVRPQGPAFRRSGTKFVKAGKLPDLIITDVADAAGFYQITTSTYHGLTGGETVTIAGTGTTADGVRTVTALVDGNIFYLTEPYVSVSSTGTVTRSARIIPFTVSDETAYELEFGDRYIHFYKNKEPLFETTTTEVEKYTIADNGGLAQIDCTVDDDGDLPGWGTLSGFIGAPANNGTVTQSAGFSNKVRLTCSVPHTLRTGCTVKLYSFGADPNSINNTTKTVSRVSPYIVDLESTAFVNVVGVTGTAMLSTGLLAGDRVYFSDGHENTVLADTFQTVKSVDTYDKFTVANVAFASIVDTTPSAEEVHCIPIEVVTTFTEGELADIRYAQSADVLYIFHPDHPTQKLVRLDTDGDRNDWLLATVDSQDGPYLPFNDLTPNVDTTTPANGTKYDDVYFEVSAYAHTANVTAAVAFGAGDNGEYLEYRDGDQWRLALLNTGQGTSSGTVSIIDNVLLSLDETTRLQSKKSNPIYIPGSATSSPVQYQGNMGNNSRARAQQRLDPNDSVRSSGTGGSGDGSPGTIKSQFANTFSASDIGKYLRYQDNASPPVYRWALITSIPRTPTAGTGSEAVHTTPVAMVTINSTGNFVVSGESRTATLRSYRSGSTFAAFAATDVGRSVRLGFAGRWTWGKITGFTSSSQVTITLYEDMPRDPHNASNVAGALNGELSASSTTGRTYDWRMGAWSATTGYPTCGAFHEQRLWFGGNTTAPATIWGSVSGDFEIMLPSELDSTVLDDNGIAYTLGSTKANAIKWLVSGPAMTVGTSGGEWQVRAASSVNDAITPSNIKATEYTGHGALGTAIPARVGSSILFVDRSGEKVQESFYSYEKDAVDSDDLTVISEHILRTHGGAVASAFQEKPHSILWVACADGTLSGMTFNKKQEVVGWHHHTIQGGAVEDISVIPSADASEDELWMVVRRTINGVTVRYIEVLEADFYPTSASSRLGMKFLDAHRYISGFTGDTITGLNYLEGQSVVVVKDGTRVAGTFTISGGSTGDIGTGATSELLIGLLGNADMQSLPPEGGSQFGTAQGQTKRVVYLDGRFYNTDSVSHGPSASSLITVTLPTNPNWFTGTFRLTPAMGYDVESSWYIRQSEPYPLNILFVVTKLETNE